MKAKAVGNKEVSRKRSLGVILQPPQSGTSRSTTLDIQFNVVAIVLDADLLRRCSAQKELIVHEHIIGLDFSTVATVSGLYLAVWLPQNKKQGGRLKDVRLINSHKG